MRCASWERAQAESKPSHSSATIPGVHDVQGIESALDLPHHLEAGAKLRLKVLHLALADTVLAGAGAIHGDGALSKTLKEGFDLRAVSWFERRGGMEVAVTDMTHDRCNQATFLDVFLRLQHALGQSRDRHANVGCQHFPPCPRRFHGPVGVVARFHSRRRSSFRPNRSGWHLRQSNFFELLHLVAR